MHLSRCLFNSTSSIAKLLALQNTTTDISLKGWVTSVQRFGKMYFVKITDRTCPVEVQAVLPRNFFSQPINVGSAVELSGVWTPSRGSQQAMELLVEQCHFVGYNEQSLLPANNDVLRQRPHLRPKNPEFAAILRLRSRLTHLSHNFFAERNFVHVDPPLLSRNDCEGAGEVFRVESLNDDDFFGETDVFLSVSSQLHLEAISGGLPQVYTISPAFRADKSLSRQHLSEFRMLEAECAFVNDVDELCDLVEDYLRFVAANLARCAAYDLRISEPLCKRTKHLLDYFASGDRSIPRISHADALKMLKLDGKLSKADELYLVEKFGGPVFVQHFPPDGKPFYMKRTADGLFVENFDLLAPFVGELAGGSVRESDADALIARLPQSNNGDVITSSSASSNPPTTSFTINEPQSSRKCADENSATRSSFSDATMTMTDEDHEAELNWYMTLRRAGYPRSAGFGLGIERLVQSMFGVENVKDTVAFPRWFKHCKC